MSSRQLISGEIQEIWSKLNSKWQGDTATAFHREYILRLSEVSDSFEDACTELGSLSENLSKELQMIEQSLAN